MNLLKTFTFWLSVIQILMYIIALGCTYSNKCSNLSSKFSLGLSHPIFNGYKYALCYKCLENAKDEVEKFVHPVFL